MISDHAHKQNKAERQVLEGLGYKFSLGHNGWDLFFNDDNIAQGPCYAKGEQAYRECLDTAVNRAIKHRKETMTVITPEPAPEPAPEVKISKIQKKTVEAAIKLLVAAGAQYTIILGDEKHSNMPEAPEPKRVRVSSEPFWGPVLRPLEGTGPFTAAVEIPEGHEPAKFCLAVRSYLQVQYGRGTYTTERDDVARKLEILVHDAPFKEDGNE